MTDLTEAAILDFYYSCLNEGDKIGDAIATILQQLNEDEQQETLGLLITEAIIAFAHKVDAFPDDSTESLQNYFSAYCQFEHLTDWESMIAETINSAAAEFEPDDDEDEDYTEDESLDDEDGVITNLPWEKLSNSERIAKVKALLRNIADSGSAFGGAEYSLIKQNIGNKPDPYGNAFGSKVKVFNRKASNYGWGPENEKTPEGSSYLQTESFTRQHFETAAAAIRAIENRAKRQMHADFQADIFSKSNPRFDAARFHKAAGSQYKPKNKTLKEESRLANLPILEGLQQNSNVQKYKEFMDRTHVQTLNCAESPAEALREANKMRDEAAKREAQSGEAPYRVDDYLFGRNRPGRRK